MCILIKLYYFVAGNPKDKVLYGRSPSKRAQLERRHSLRLFGSNKRLSALHRTGSMRHIPNRQLSTETSSADTSIAASLAPSQYIMQLFSL